MQRARDGPASPCQLRPAHWTCPSSLTFARDTKRTDAVLDRLLERANRIELVGESLRRSETTTAAKPRNAK